MEFNPNLLILGVALLVLSYFVGVKKQTWMLSGYNKSKVKDKDKLTKIMGGYNLLAGGILFILSFVFTDTSNRAAEISIILPIVLGYILISIYVQVRMVKR
ncbi:DUF3784 domain-containing protein [Halobacillus litoralis]|uniref:DUF3784 domain-containing protein n=1 Tax=Halobacillus litoralis TaxID=45668 RepID=UPI001CFF10F8|nr:DUF3784 domain-containing protein [Halobacillus litoralis]